MKKIFSYILFFMIGINVFGLSGNLAGEKDLKIIKTKWLDIIYPESCEKSAAILQENGDKIFIEVTAQYGLEPDFHLPIVLTPTIDAYNAFYTGAPYNRIVLFDTSSQTLDDLSSFKESLLSTFRHELTHAVTYNMKNGFWKGFTNIFGDAMVPGYFFITSGMAEGAAVASESANGEGRLNDEFTKHIVKQAKIEGKFPNYYDVQGAGDNMIPGIQYYFNGPFHQWLQKKYGMEKYADFWHKVVNVNRPGVAWSFKKVYGTSIRKAWKEFEESYEIPENIKEPEWAGKEIKTNNDQGVRYSSFSKSEKGIYFVEETSRSIYFVDWEMLFNNKIKPKKILSHKGIDNASVSGDGEVVAVSYFTNMAPGITAKIKLFNLKTGREISVSEDGVKNGRVMQWKGDYYLICHQFNSPHNRLLIYKINFENNQLEKIYSHDFEVNTFVSDFTDLGNGNFAYIKKVGLNYFITISDFAGNIVHSFKMPENIKIRHLSENNGQIYFTWVGENTMPRLGFLNLENIQLSLSKEDVSGGIYYPLIFNYADSQRAAYLGKFYESDKIFETEINSELFTNVEKITVGEEENLKNQNKNYADSKAALLVEDYKWYKNLYGGLIIPLSLYEKDVPLPFGVTFASSNPWSNGADDLFILTAGWGYLTNSFGVEAMINQGTATSLLSYSLDVKSEFDKNGWKYSGGQLMVGSGFNFGKISSLSFDNIFQIEGGRENNFPKNLTTLDTLKFWDHEVFESFAPIDNTTSFNIYDFVKVTYSNITKKGPGRFQYGGIEAEGGVGYVYDSKRGQGFAVTGSFGGMIPELIPVKQVNGLVYNLPVKFNCTLLPLASAYGLTGATHKSAGESVLDTYIETVLFGLDVQRAIPYFDILFIQDFYIAAGYSSTIASYKGTKRGFQLPYVFDYFGNLGNGKSIYLDSFYIKAELDFVANIGVLASDMFTNSVFVQLNVPINVVPGMKKSVVFDFGVQLGF